MVLYCNGLIYFFIEDLLLTKIYQTMTNKIDHTRITNKKTRTIKLNKCRNRQRTIEIHYIETLLPAINSNSSVYQTQILHFRIFKQQSTKTQKRKCNTQFAPQSLNNSQKYNNVNEVHLTLADSGTEVPSFTVVSTVSTSSGSPTNLFERREVYGAALKEILSILMGSRSQHRLTGANESGTRLNCCSL